MPGKARRIGAPAVWIQQMAPLGTGRPEPDRGGCLFCRSVWAAGLAEEAEDPGDAGAGGLLAQADVLLDGFAV